MIRLLAFGLVLLAMLAAAWWGLSQTGLLPGGTDRPAEAETSVPETPATLGETAKTTQPEGATASQDPATDDAGTAALTQPPQDDPLPPETGSDMAIEVERVAEAAIAAADARAEAEAIARAEAKAMEVAQAQLAELLGPALSATSPAATPESVARALTELPPADDAQVSQQRAALETEIKEILDRARAAQSDVASPEPEAQQAGETAASDGETSGSVDVFDFAPFIAEIRELL
ncbi:hypothetical protein [Paracoccus sp. SCSIO 75233]|uniref:hypothetical protein n=1 Tax=Paracoccus sp. SCSIO 75233 TaxID=3017782 RepID=UPI0022F0CB23|nr:hypothetical protein [Paracoccus sp. SCSIO 75233]WBU52342.1 hypothetical protein PAF12_10925 [Paracoccus sp. SCSIO 75233]